MEDNCAVYSASVAEREGVVAVRLQGMFYNAYSDSAKVLSVVTGYKIKQNTATSQLKCGFPSNALEKVKELFQRENVSFMAFDKDHLVCFFSSGRDGYDRAMKQFSDASIIRPYLSESGNHNFSKRAAFQGHICNDVIKNDPNLSDEFKKTYLSKQNNVSENKNKEHKGGFFSRFFRPRIKEKAKETV